MSVCPTVSVLRFYGCCHPCYKSILFIFNLKFHAFAIFRKIRLNINVTECLSVCLSVYGFCKLLHRYVYSGASLYRFKEGLQLFLGRVPPPSQKLLQEKSTLHSPKNIFFYILNQKFQRRRGRGLYPLDKGLSTPLHLLIQMYTKNILQLV